MNLLELFEGSSDDDDEDDEYLFTSPAEAKIEEIKEIQLESDKLVKHYVGSDHFDTPSRDVQGDEVGDDRVDRSTSPPRLATIIVGQERVMGMCTSWDSTSISYRCFEFCNIISPIPRHRFEGWTAARKSGSGKNLQFADIIPHKVTSLFTKGVSSDYASTAHGKMAYARSRRVVNNPYLTPLIEVQNIIQDSCLRVDQGSEPKYIPVIMGGTGNPAAFNRPENLFIFAHFYKNGKYQRILASLVEEARHATDCIDSLKPYSAPLLKVARMKQTFLHGTYEEKVHIPRIDKMTYPELSVPLYEATEQGGISTNVEDRLIRANLLVKRSDAEVLIEDWYKKQMVISNITDAKTTIAAHKLQAKARRLEINSSLKGITELSRLLNRSASHYDSEKLEKSKDFVTSRAGRLKFSMEDAVWLWRGGQGKTCSISDITHGEDVFAREDIADPGTFKVPGIQLEFLLGQGKPRIETTVKRYGLYEISSTMYEWAQQKYAQLIDLADVQKPIRRDLLSHVFTKDLEWVSDDSALMQQAADFVRNHETKNRTIYAVTGDQKLAKRIRDITSMDVVAINPIQLIVTLGLDFINSKTELSYKDLKPLIPMGFKTREGPVLIDSGYSLGELWDKVLESPRPFHVRKPTVKRRVLDGVEITPTKTVVHLYEKPIDERLLPAKFYSKSGW